jgi:peptidoglycan hydrolase-like protein with peptidoglycan-binding domain
MAKKLGMTARLGLAGLTMMGLAGCSWFGGSRETNPPPSPSPAAATTPPTAPVAPVTIKDVQSALQQAGYYKNGRVDGVWGRGTERAVTQFQHDHNLPANGKLDVPTLQALNLTGTPPATPGSSNPPPNNAAPSNPAPPPPPPNNPPAGSESNQPTH